MTWGRADSRGRSKPPKKMLHLWLGSFPEELPVLICGQKSMPLPWLHCFATTPNLFKEVPNWHGVLTPMLLDTHANLPPLDTKRLCYIAAKKLPENYSNYPDPHKPTLV
eukprot:1138591-Pelagomonas_calceolata.AAC.4